MRWLVTVPILFFCTIGYSADTESSSELSYVPTGLEISEGPSSAAPPSLGPLGGIAQVISAAASEKSWLPDFNFVRGVDLNWDSWFAPSGQSSDEW